MPVDGNQAAAVVDHDRIPIAAHPAGIHHYAGCRRMDRRAIIHPDVHPGMILPGTEDGMYTPAVIGSDRTGAGPYKGTVTAAGGHHGSGFQALQHGFDVIRDRQQAVVFRFGLPFFFLCFVQFLGPLFPHFFRIIALLHQGGLILFDFRHLGIQQILPPLNFRRFFLHDGDQIQIAADDLLQQVHTGSKIAKIFGAQQHFQIIDLAVLIDITETAAVNPHPPFHFLFLFAQYGCIFINIFLQRVRFFLQLVNILLQAAQFGNDLAQAFFGRCDFQFCLVFVFFRHLHIMLGLIQFLLLLFHFGGCQGRKHVQQEQPYGKQDCENVT